MSRDRRIPPSLPSGFFKHTVWFAAALVAFVAVVACRESGHPAPAVVSVPLGLASWLIATVYILYYVCAYPIVHVAQRYRGRNQTIWLVWLSVELCGLTFGLVRLLYFFEHILPDRRRSGMYRAASRG